MNNKTLVLIVIAVAIVWLLLVKKEVSDSKKSIDHFDNVVQFEEYAQHYVDPQRAPIPRPQVQTSNPYLSNTPTYSQQQTHTPQRRLRNGHQYVSTSDGIWVHDIDCNHADHNLRQTGGQSFDSNLWGY